MKNDIKAVILKKPKNQKKPYFFIKRTFFNICDSKISLYTTGLDKNKVKNMVISLAIYDKINWFFKYFEEQISSSNYPNITTKQLIDNHQTILISCNFDNVDQTEVKITWYFSFEDTKKYFILLDSFISFLKKINYIDYEYKQFTKINIIKILCLKFKKKIENIVEIEEYSELIEGILYLTIGFKDSLFYNIQIDRKNNSEIFYSNIDKLLLDH